MSQLIEAVIHSNQKNDLLEWVNTLRASARQYLLRNEIETAFSQFCREHHPEASYCTSPLGELIACTQEILIEPESVCWTLRPQIAARETYRLVLPELTVEPLTIPEVLDLRDRFVNHFHPDAGDVFEIDMKPFYDYSPLLRDSHNIGKGLQFLNRFLSSQRLDNPTEGLLELQGFLSKQAYRGMPLLINDRIQNPVQLSDQLKRAIAVLNEFPGDLPYESFRFDLQTLGFEPGWGNSAARVRETLELLDRLIDSPDDKNLETFLTRLPTIFNIVLVSVHGWFGQEGVLGRPDTGGQVVYVLDQARSLELQLEEQVELAGLSALNIEPKVIILTRLIHNSDGTRCNERLEKVHGTKNAWILRVPFREFNPNMTQNWISRFEIWPYLETYAIDAEKELYREFQGKPDLIIGNYSDGNLVAFLLARRLGVPQFIIAHALEKSKYRLSDLYWQELEDNYHFSLQFTADLIAMNAANCIISSTYQEIIGRLDSVGQYESYQSFTMPDLYHVVCGIEVFSPKFNVVPPGVNETVFFPYDRTQERLHSLQASLEELLFTLDDPAQTFGKLADPNKRPIFSMARLDRIKNLTGLAECFGRSPELQEHCNLILVAGKLHVEESGDAEERDQIEQLYRIIEQYNLYDKIRWLGVRLPKADSGEIYRVIADRRGIFVQPALFEAFGLTILESMITGLPTFGTQFGGPLEIIEDGKNGFYINPTNLEETAQKILNFVCECEANPDRWLEIARGGIDRVYSAYTWKIHTTKLLSLARVYGFWNFTAKENREDLLRYLESLFYLIYKPRAKALLERHQSP